MSTSEGGKEILVAQDLAKSYWLGKREIKVLDGLNLVVNKGEIVAIVGKSGVGKSTLLHILGTIDTPDRGKVFFEDMEVFALSSHQRDRFRNQKIGFVFQFHHLLSEFTALENVMLPALIGGISRDVARKRALDILESLGIENRKDHLPDELSGGEQQRVAIARALIMQPGMILADEPTGNLDVATSREVNALLKELNTNYGITFVMATHSPQLASIADRVLVLESGRLREASGD